MNFKIFFVYWKNRILKGLKFLKKWNGILDVYFVWFCFWVLGDIVFVSFVFENVSKIWICIYLFISLKYMKIYIFIVDNLILEFDLE